MKTFKILGLLMSYPKPEWIAHLGDCWSTLQQEDLLPSRSRKAVLALIERLATSDVFELQEDYVETFDRGRSHSLYLFEHIHGESRDRGQAMVDLAEAYEAKGLFIGRAELPDYLPLFLEFLSLCPPDEALELLAEPIDIIATVGERLRKRDSAYAGLFTALAALSRVKPSPDRVAEALAGEAEDDSLEALDKAWEEEAAFAGKPGQPDCGACMASNDRAGIAMSLREASK